MPKYNYCAERGKFKSSVRIALFEKFLSYGRKKQKQKANRQTNKQTKQTKAQQKRSPIFRKLRVASAFSFETKKGKCLGHVYRALQS